VLRHVALFGWKPETTAADASKVEAGRDLGVQDGNADFALVADFTDQEGLVTYANHPDHQAVIHNLIRPILAQREAIQYVIDHSD
jgi:hypothetical protein